MKNKVAIVLNGPIDSFLTGDIKNYAMVIAVDGGLNHLVKYNMEADLFIGDCDSVNEDALIYMETSDIDRIEYDVEKDKTDFELALAYVKEKCKIKKIDVFCALGGKADHTMTVLNNVLAYSKDLDITVFGGQQAAKVLNEGDKLRVLNRYDVVSFSMVPVDEDLTVSIESARWELDHKTVKKESSLLMSNKAMGEYALVTAHKNRAFVFTTLFL